MVLILSSHAIHQEVLLEQERLKSLNGQLQHKIAEYLAKKKVTRIAIYGCVLWHVRSLFHFRVRSVQTQVEMSLTRRRDTISAWVRMLRNDQSAETVIVLSSSAALEVLEMDLGTLQQRSELQYAHLQVLRDQKLAEVKQAMYASMECLYLDYITYCT